MSNAGIRLQRPQLIESSKPATHPPTRSFLNSRVLPPSFRAQHPRVQSKSPIRFLQLEASNTTWTVERIRALGLITDIATAAQIFGLSRAAAYDLAKRDRFPVAVLRFGSRYRVPVAAILHALGLTIGDEQPPSRTT